MAQLTQQQVQERLNQYTISANYKEFTKEEFYKLIGDEDIIINVEDVYNYPYVSLFTTRHRLLVGKSIPVDVHGLKPNRYFISKKQSIVEI